MAIAQETWSFNTAKPLLSEGAKLSLNLHTIKESPEFVAGIVGKALRTDGYSTWLEGTIDKPFQLFQAGLLWSLILRIPRHLWE